MSKLNEVAIKSPLIDAQPRRKIVAGNGESRRLKVESLTDREGHRIFIFPIALLIAFILSLASISQVSAQEDDWCDGVEPAFHSFPVLIYFDDRTEESVAWQPIVAEVLSQLDDYVPIQRVDQPIPRGEPGINIEVVPADQIPEICESSTAAACTVTEPFIETQGDESGADTVVDPSSEIAWVIVNLPPVGMLANAQGTLIHEGLHPFLVGERHSLDPNSSLYRAQNNQDSITPDVAQCLTQLYGLRSSGG